MPRTPQVSGREMVKVLQKVGFVAVSQESSHIKLRRFTDGTTQTVIVPDHKVVRQGTFHGILRLAHLPLGDFLKLHRG